MKIGISTASLFLRENTEDALKFLSENKVESAEVFLESYCDYNKKYGKLLKKVKKDVDVNSVHVLTTQFEPQLFSLNERAKKDSFVLLKGAMECAKEIGAKYYTFHGQARYKITQKGATDYDLVGKCTQEIIDFIKPYGITLAFENVHWGSYNHAGFFGEIKKRTKGLKATLDIKQARQSGVFYGDYITDMGSDLVTVHLSDVDENGKMCLPGKGTTDFKDLFIRLKDVGFDGALIIEAYAKDYEKTEELLDSLDFIYDIKEGMFK